MLSEEKFIDNKKNALGTTATIDSANQTIVTSSSSKYIAMPFESYQTRIKELEDALNKILNECVPGVAGYYVIEKIVKEVLNESR